MSIVLGFVFGVLLSCALLVSPVFFAMWKLGLFRGLFRSIRERH